MKSTAIVFFHAACKMNKKKEMIAEGNQFSFSGRERPFFFGEIYMITPPFRHLSAMMTKRSYELVWLGRSSIENSNVSEISSHVKFDVWLQSHQGRPTNRKKAPMMAEKKWPSPYRRDEEFNFLFWTFVSYWSIVIHSLFWNQTSSFHQSIKIGFHQHKDPRACKDFRADGVIGIHCSRILMLMEVQRITITPSALESLQALRFWS